MATSAPLAERRRLYDAAVANPGSTARELELASGLERTRCLQQLQRLQREGHLRAERGEYHEFYFATSGGRTADPARALAGSATARALVVALLEAPDVGLADLAVRLRRTPAALGPYLRRLLRLGVVVDAPPGTEGRRFRLPDRARIASMFAGPSPGPLGRGIDSVTETFGELLPEG